MSSVTTVLTSVRRIDDPRSIIRPQIRYAMIIVAEDTAVIAPTNELEALKWSTRRIGYTARFMRFPMPNTVNDRRRRRYL
jgi:hypothetical protein